MQSPQRRGKKSRSGNPAKRAAEERAMAERRARGPEPDQPKKGSAFGLGGAPTPPAPGQLPTGLGGLFGS
jgi:signal recognition particle subunit SRP54